MGSMFGLDKRELTILRRLNTPIKIQDFLDQIPLNWEKKGETYFSPRKVLRESKAHCFEGALLACVALWLRGEEPLLLDLKAKGDDDHVVALYQRHGYWGAISKTNHASLRFRDPVYKNLRELALSYFHEYFNNDNGKKTLVAYSVKPFSLKKFGVDWITSEEDLDFLVEALDQVKHQNLVPEKNKKLIRRADQVERRAGELIEWQKNDPRT